MAEPAFRLCRLKAGYPDTPVLRSIDLDLAPGVLHGIIGPNGCGKTTLLNVMAGLMAPEAGIVELLSRDLAGYSRPDLARTLALAPQEGMPDFPFTVADAALMGRHPHIPRFAGPSEEDHRLAQEALAAVDMTDLASRPLSRLSGGERQRAALARVLAQDTPVLLLDEPTANMDVRHGLATMTLLRDLAREGRTVVAVLHDLNLAAAFCERLVLMRRGAIHDAGLTAEVLTPENLERVFKVRAQVRPDEFGGGLALSFREAE